MSAAQNLKTTFAMTAAALASLSARGGGAIVNIASIAGLVASPRLPAYAAAKAGVISLTKSLARVRGARHAWRLSRGRQAWGAARA